MALWGAADEVELENTNQTLRNLHLNINNTKYIKVFEYVLLFIFLLLNSVIIYYNRKVPNNIYNIFTVFIVVRVVFDLYRIYRA